MSNRRPTPAKFQISASWTITPAAFPQVQQPPNPSQAQPFPGAYFEVRREYREERASAVIPLFEAAQAADKAAVSLAQSYLKSAMLLNGGGILAIPAIISLFNIDAEKIAVPLFWTAFIFILGLVSAWLAYLTAFFCKAHLSDQFSHSAKAEGRKRDAMFHPIRADEFREEATAAENKAKAHEIRFKVWRCSAIFCAILSLGFFITASWKGGAAIRSAPHKVTIAR